MNFFLKKVTNTHDPIPGRQVVGKKKRKTLVLDLILGLVFCGIAILNWFVTQFSLSLFTNNEPQLTTKADGERSSISPHTTH